MLDLRDLQYRPSGRGLLYCGSVAAADAAAARYTKHASPPKYLSVKDTIVLRLDDRLSSTLAF